MKLLTACLLAALGLTAAHVATAADTADTTVGAVAAQIDRFSAGRAPLVVWNREIVVFRASYRGLTPPERAEAAAQRFRNLAITSLSDSVRSEPVQLGDSQGRMIQVGAVPLFAVLSADVDSAAGETLDLKVAAAQAHVREVLQARALSQSKPLLVRGVLYSLLATLLLIILFNLARFLRRRLPVWMSSRPLSPARLHVGSLNLDRHVRTVLRKVFDVLSWVALSLVLYLWITFVFSQFPYTMPWAKAFGVQLLEGLGTLGLGILHALPGLGMVALIFLLTRIALRAMTGLFEAVEQGHVSIPGIHPDTADATRRIVGALLWLFAIIVAYPYLPGSDSAIFKGVSVFAGLMFSLGASGILGQVMSGLVVIYSRSVRPGELVRIGEHEGIVTEIGMLSSKIRTIRKEEITIPNSVLVGSVTTNFSRLADQQGGVLATSISVGYDIPWRQVHALLIQAAERTSEVRKDPAPRVLQRSLSDFAVEYQLHVHIKTAEHRILVLSELHGNIQDAFNEFGVQILSPHYESQPDRRVVVPPAQWHEPPAAPPGSSQLQQ